MALNKKGIFFVGKSGNHKKAKDYDGSKTNFANLIRIPYSTLQIILKQADFTEKKLKKMSKMAKKRKKKYEITF